MQDFQVDYRFAVEASDYMNALLEICEKPIDQGHAVVLEHFEVDGGPSEILEADVWPSRLWVVEDEANRKDLEANLEDPDRGQVVDRFITEIQEKAIKQLPPSLHRRRRGEHFTEVYTRAELASRMAQLRGKSIDINRTGPNSLVRYVFKIDTQ